MKKIITQACLLGLVSAAVAQGSETTLTFQPGGDKGKDSRIASLHPTLNHGNDQYFHVQTWTWSGDEGKYRSLVEFDLTSIEPQKVVKSAKLFLYSDKYKTTSQDGHSSLTSSNASVLHRVTSPWTENLVTWNNQPSISLTEIVNIPASTSNYQTYEIDVTTMVQDMVNNPSKNNGFLLKLKNEVTYAGLYFATSDYTGALGAVQPKLVVTIDGTTSAEDNTLNSTSISMNGTSNPIINAYNGNLFSVEIINSNGTILQNEKNISSFAFDNFESGFYFVKITDSFGTSTKKIVVQK